MGARQRDRAQPGPVTVGTPITQDESAEMFRTFRESAFHLETREFYAMTNERDAFQRFLDGHPLSPAGLPWWQTWLDQMRELARQGKRIGRVRVLSEPPSDYQRWELWGTSWHIKAGEEIRYMSRRRAEQIGLPLNYDWWLFDDERLIVTRFTDSGEIAEKSLITDPGIIAQHRAWRDLAVRNATTAETFAAA
jgi:hypothetical protein